MITKLDLTYFLKEERNKLGDIISEPGVILLSSKDKNTASRYLLLRPETDGWITYLLQGDPVYTPFKVKQGEVLDAYMSKFIFIPYEAKIWEDSTVQNRIIEPTEETIKLAADKVADIKEREEFRQRKIIRPAKKRQLHRRTKEQLKDVHTLTARLQKQARYYESLPAEHKDSLQGVDNVTLDELCEWTTGKPDGLSYEAGCFYILTRVNASDNKKFKAFMELVEKFRAPNYSIQYFLLSMKPISAIHVLAYVYFAYQIYADRTRTTTLLSNTIPESLEIALNSDKNIAKYKYYLQTTKQPKERLHPEDSALLHVKINLDLFIQSLNTEQASQ